MFVYVEEKSITKGVQTINHFKVLKITDKLVVNESKYPYLLILTYLYTYTCEFVFNAFTCEPLNGI